MFTRVSWPGSSAHSAIFLGDSGFLVFPPPIRACHGAFVAGKCEWSMPPLSCRVIALDICSSHKMLSSSVIWIRRISFFSPKKKKDFHAMMGQWLLSSPHLAAKQKKTALSTIGKRCTRKQIRVGLGQAVHQRDNPQDRTCPSFN